MRILAFSCLLLLAVACKPTTNTSSETAPKTNDTLVALDHLKKLDSTLTAAYQQVTENDAKLPTKLIAEVIDSNEQFVAKYPKNAYAPIALDKAHQLNIQLKQYEYSLENGKRIIEDYPSYKNINEIIYSVATTYDFMMNQTDSAKVYYQLLLSKKGVSKSIKKDIETRLKQLK